MSTPFRGLGKALRIIRKRRGWSQSVWSERSKVSPSNISKYELERLDPSVRTLDKLLNAAEATLSELDEVLRLGRGEAPEVPEPSTDVLNDIFESGEELDTSEENLLRDLTRMIMRERSRKPKDG